MAVFKTAALNHSATTPGGGKLLYHSELRKRREVTSQRPALSCGEICGESSPTLPAAIEELKEHAADAAAGEAGGRRRAAGRSGPRQQRRRIVDGAEAAVAAWPRTRVVGKVLVRDLPSGRTCCKGPPAGSWQPEWQPQPCDSLACGGALRRISRGRTGFSGGASATHDAGVAIKAWSRPGAIFRVCLAKCSLLRIRLALKR